jgi:Glycosyl transferase family 2
VPAHSEVAAREYVSEQSRARRRRCAPEFGVEPETGDPTDRRDGAQKRAARAQNPMRVLHGRLQVVDVLERLGEDEAVEELAGYRVGCGKICDDRGGFVRGIDIEDVSVFDGDTEAIGVIGVHDLEHAAPNRVPFFSKEPFDVVPVHWRSALAPPVVAQRRRPANRSEPRGSAEPLQPSPPSKAVIHGRRLGRLDHGRRRYFVRRPILLAVPMNHDEPQCQCHQPSRREPGGPVTTTVRVFRAPPIARELEERGAPTFSVVIAAYNAADTIAEAVESALGQTLPPFEVVVCDDGSTDRTVAELEPYRDRVIYMGKQRGGVASAWNAALERAKGEFFAVLGADDAYMPTRLEALAELAVARSDLDILCTDAFLELERQPVVRFGEDTKFELADQRSAILERCFCVAPAVRRSKLIDAGGFDESLYTGSDWECVIRLIHRHAVAGLVDEPLYRYRLHDRSVTADRVRTLRDRLVLLERVRQMYDLSDAERAALARSLARQRASLVLTEAEAALRAGSGDARSRAFAAARTETVGLRTRAAALAAALAPKAAARALERREARSGRSRLRRSVEGRS